MRTVAIVPAATEAVRSRDVHHPFRQSSDLHPLGKTTDPDDVRLHDVECTGPQEISKLGQITDIGERGVHRIPPFGGSC